MLTLITHKSCPGEFGEKIKFYIQGLQKYDSLNFLMAFRIFIGCYLS